MKKILTIAVAVCALVFALSSCADITESIKNTLWVADLSIYDEIDTGEATIFFTSNGYQFSWGVSDKDVIKAGGSQYIGEVFYEYPTVKIPYENNEVTYYWIGTVSEDGKQMIIKEFEGKVFGLLDGLLHDVVFTRK